MKTFVIIWAGQLVSTLGSALTSFALGVWVYQTTGSPTLFATSMLAWVLPNLLLSPVAGVLADRWDRRLVMIFADTGAALSSLFVVAMLFTGELQVWHVYMSGFFNAAFSTFQWPAYSAATAQLVPKQHLGRAGGMTQIGDAISHLAGPAIAGALFVTAGLKAVLAIDVASYLVALATLLSVRFPRPVRTSSGDDGKGPFLREAAYGWSVIRRMPGLLGLLMVFATANFLMNITFPLYTPLILGITTVDKLGYLNSVGGLGMLVGTVIMSVWGGPKRRIRGILAAETLLGLTMLLFGLRLTIPLLAINNFFFMIATPISSGCSQAIWQTKISHAAQGRVFAIRRVLAFVAMPLAYAASGPLAEQVFEPAMVEGGAWVPVFGWLVGTGPGHGIALMFVLAGALYMLAILVIPLHPRIWRLELEIPDAQADVAGIAVS